MNSIIFFGIVAFQCIGYAIAEDDQPEMTIYEMYADLKTLINKDECTVGDDPKKFRGLDILTEDAMIAFGKNKDIKMLRTGDNELKISSDTVTFTGDVQSTTTDALLKRLQALEDANKDLKERLASVEGKLRNSGLGTVYENTWVPLDKAGVTVTASTSWSDDYNPSKLVEGQNNPWHGKGNGQNQWLQFAFSDAERVAGFRYQAHTGWDGSSFKDYRFEKSDDGKEWTSVKEGQGTNLDCCAWEEITWDTAPSAKYFRLFMVNDWGYKWLSINRLELFIAIPVGGYKDTWIALDKADVTVTASTSWSDDYNPSKLVEGQNNPWHGRGNGQNQWLQFAFSNDRRLGGFRYQAHTGWDGSSFKDYRFEKSNDGSNWVTVKSGQGVNLDCCEWEEITWDGTPSAKYFRLFMVNDWGYKWLSINRLELLM